MLYVYDQIKLWYLLLQLNCIHTFTPVWLINYRLLFYGILQGSEWPTLCCCVGRGTPSSSSRSACWVSPRSAPIISSWRAPARVSSPQSSSGTARSTPRERSYAIATRPRAPIACTLRLHTCSSRSNSSIWTNFSHDVKTSGLRTTRFLCCCATSALLFFDGRQRADRCLEKTTRRNALRFITTYISAILQIWRAIVSMGWTRF